MQRVALRAKAEGQLPTERGGGEASPCGLRPKVGSQLSEEEADSQLGARRVLL